MLVLPSPKLQSHCPMGYLSGQEGCDLSINWTVRGAGPVVGLASKNAVGAPKLLAEKQRIKVIVKINIKKDKDLHPLFFISSISDLLRFDDKKFIFFIGFPLFLTG